MSESPGPTSAPRARSAWVDEHQGRLGFAVQATPQRDDPGATRAILDAGLLAEELGYDAFMLSDHPAYSPECWLHLGALAAITSRIRLGSAVNCALYRQPVMTARLAADLDNLSGGRALLGLGAGWNATEFAQLGLPFPNTADRLRALEETVEIILGVWGDEPFTYRGQHVWCDQERVFPPPVQRPNVPIIIAGGGERFTLKTVATYADACNFGPSDTTGGARTRSDIERKFAVLQQHAASVGRPYENILRTHFTSWLFVAETDAEAQAKLRRYHPDPLTPVQRISRVAGNPATVAAIYQDLIAAGFTYFIIQTQDARDLETIRLFATDVIPRLTEPRSEDR